MARAKLPLTFRIFQHDQLVAETTLGQTVIKIGKVPSAHLRIDDETVSRMHAIIEVVGDGVSVIDLGSTGGTFVNGQRINKARLQSGDTIQVGETRIEVAIGAAEATAAIEPAAVEPAAIVASTPPPLPAPAPPIAAPVAPPIARPVARPVAPVAFAVPADEPDIPGARAVEVAAMLGDSMVGVKHCMDPRGGRITHATWAIAAGGLACLLASVIAFTVSITTAARNEAALEVHVERGKPAYAFRPERVGPVVDVFAFGGLAVGIAGLTFALARARRERRSPWFRIGTAPGVELPLEQAPSPSFPLVAPRGDDFVFNFGAGIDGELIVDGHATSFAELVQQGKARPSQETPGALELAIPASSRIRARAGQATFVVTGVARPAEHAAPLFAFENRTLAYLGGSLAVHLLAVLLLSTIPIDDSGVNIQMALDPDLSARAATTTNEDTPPEPETGDTGEDGGESSTSMALAEGAAGKPTSPRTDGRLEIKNRDREPQMSRQQAIDYAMTSGVLGAQEAIQGSIASLTGTGAISSGFGDADIYGPLFGAGGEGRGNFGFGREGYGPGAGCLGGPCGTVGSGRYGTIPGGRGAGDGYRGPRRGWGRGDGHTAQVPPPTIGMPTATTGLDRAIIKRYIKRNVHKIAYCYESELLARPGIEGSVMVSFLISSNGKVTSAKGTGFDGKVAGCVAGVVKNIAFPRTDGGPVQVNYPFTFHAAGK